MSKGLGYGPAIGSVQAARDAVNHTLDERFSIGVLARTDGSIVDVVADSPTWNTGLGPGMKMVSVNRRPFTPTALRDAIAHDPSAAVELEVRNGSDAFTAKLDERRGARYPHLERGDGSDALTAILTPRAP